MSNMNWLALISSLFLTACGDPHEECVVAKQEAFRKANPKASYAVLATANEKFRENCKSSAQRA